MRYHFADAGNMVAGGTHKRVVGCVPLLKSKGGISMPIAVIISIISVTFSVFFGIVSLVLNTKSSKRTDTKDIEERVKDNTQINMKLDSINSTTQDIKVELASMRSDIKSHNDKIIVLEQSCKQAHHRIDSLEERLNGRSD